MADNSLVDNGLEAADIARTQTVATPPLFVTTNHFYVVTHDAPGGVAGYEFSVNADPTILIFASTTNPTSAINVGTFPNFIVGAGTCLNSNGGLYLTDHMYGIFTSVVADLLVCVGGTNPSSFGGLPGWLDCVDNLIPFGTAESGDPDYPDGCMVLYPTGEPPIAAESVSFGSVKARF